jgi:hypothetical protein
MVDVAKRRKKRENFMAGSIAARAASAPAVLMEGIVGYAEQFLPEGG